MTNIQDESRAAARKRLEERRGVVPQLIVYLVADAGLGLPWGRAGAPAPQTEREVAQRGGGGAVVTFVWLLVWLIAGTPAVESWGPWNNWGTALFVCLAIDLDRKR